MRWFIFVFSVFLIVVTAPISRRVQAADFMIYSVYRGVDLGNAGETPEKDFYINMGAVHGIHEGSVLEVMRKVSTFDQLSEQLYRDVTFPIALVKVIHVESNAAIARLDKMFPLEKTPSITPRAIIVGDVVRVAASNP